MTSNKRKLAPQDISAARPDPLDRHSENNLNAEERAALAIDVAWIQWRSELRKKVVSSGVLRAPWRSVFEADMIFSIIGHRWLLGAPITLKELATYFEQFTTETTVSRHVDDMEYAGMLIREPDPADRRRLLLIPTSRLGIVAREFLQARLKILEECGFVWKGEGTEAKS